MKEQTKDGERQNALPSGAPISESVVSLPHWHSPKSDESAFAQVVGPNRFLLILTLPLTLKVSL